MIYIKSKKITENDIRREIENVKSKLYENKSKNRESINESLDYEIIEPENIIEINDTVDIDDLLKLFDEEFIKEVYKKILLRQPDKEGFSHLLNLLRTGKLSKRDIIFKIRYSKEGREKGVKIKGLFPKGFISVFSFIPIINTFVKWIKSFIFLNKLHNRLNYLENFLISRYLNLNHRAKILENDFLNLNHRVKNSEQNFLNLNQEIFRLKEEFQFFKFKLSDFLEELEIKEYLEEKVKLKVDKEKDFYFSFEDIFRGEEEKITNRLAFYLKLLKLSEKPVLDIGCGRCEFLKLLKKNKINGLGIDTNKSFINYCKKLGLNVIYEDAVKFLKNTKETFSNITMFHIFEHLTMEEQLALLRSAYSKLETGGKIIIETPNPIYWNSFASFYTDPTHIKPIPATTLAFYLEQIGFKDITIFYLHPDRKKIYKGDKLLRYYQDFAIIGKK